MIRAKPIFLLSLPRSGSTLLQRMLSAHPQIASAAEPWIMLPLAGMTGEGGTISYSNYSSRLARQALDDVIGALPNHRQDYLESVRRMVGGVYDGLCRHDEAYFLDKTPRYYLVADFLLEVFPDAKVIFLFRHPLDVLSSVLKKFSSGRLAVHHGHVDLFQGPERLHTAFHAHKDRSVSVHYEDLVEDPEAACRQITSYLDLEYVPGMVEGYKEIRFSGSMGDKSGDRKYMKVSAASTESWKVTLNTVVRRRFARRYIKNLGPDVIGTFGLSFEALIDEIDRLNTSWRGTLTDLFWLSASWGARRTAGNVVMRQWQLDPSRASKID